jgi:DNA-binding CsgD family transcriptional regulator
VHTVSSKSSSPLEQVAAHIAWLSTQGVGSRQIAQLANIGRMTVEQVPVLAAVAAA